MSRPPLFQLLVDEIPNEVERHQREKPSDEVWEAQADAFSSHLATKLVELAVAEIRAALGLGLCLHQATYGLNEAEAALSRSVSLFNQGLVAWHKAMAQQEHDEGGEG